jgi:hypothetical protein
MFTPFLLLLAAGVGFRLTISLILRKRFGLDLAIPQALAGALLVGRGNDGMYFLVRKQPMSGVHTALQCLETAPICPSITLVQHDT